MVSANGVWAILVVCIGVSLLPSLLLRLQLLSDVSDVTLMTNATAELPRHVQKTRRRTFYILPLEELTSLLIGNFSKEATEYYVGALNEESAEIWLHRGLATSPDRVHTAAEADVIVVCAYLHLNLKLTQHSKTRPVWELPLEKDDWLSHLETSLTENRHKPHVLAVPTWNPTVSRKIGVPKIVKLFDDLGIRHASLGFERNPFWQKTDATNIIVVPYVVKTDLTRQDITQSTTTSRVDDFVFYAGDERKNAVAWAGCNRTQLIGSLSNDTTTMDVRIRRGKSRLSQAAYNHRMLTSEYCLILCGDTPTSRSLASAIVHGCIPVHVGSRWWGKCEPPCRTASWGWSVTEPLSHLPYQHDEDVHREFPVLDEAAFGIDARGELKQFLGGISPAKKADLRKHLQHMQLQWMYGWGDPVSTFSLGEASVQVWNSIQHWVDHSP